MGVAAEAVTTIMAMMMTALIGMAKRINFQIIWNTFPRKTTPWLPEPCSPEISNLISLTRKSNAFLADMAICSTLTSNVRPQVNIFYLEKFVKKFKKSSKISLQKFEIKRIFGQYGNLLDIDIKRPPPVKIMENFKFCCHLTSFFLENMFKNPSNDSS